MEGRPSSEYQLGPGVKPDWRGEPLISEANKIGILNISIISIGILIFWGTPKSIGFSVSVVNVMSLSLALILKIEHPESDQILSAQMAGPTPKGLPLTNRIDHIPLLYAGFK